MANHYLLRKPIRAVLMLFVFFMSGVASYGQNVNMKLDDFRARKDSIDEKSDYQFFLPIWGDKIAKSGIDFPFPVGIGVNYLSSELDMDITDFGVQIGDVTIPEFISVPVDRNDPSKGTETKTLREAIGLEKAVARVSGYNMRLDMWVLPFLNIYGLYSYAEGSTQVQVFDKLLNPVYFNSQAFGVGTTFSYGFQGYFITADFNKSWTKSELLTNEIAVRVISMRMGKSFNLGKQRAIAVYGGFSNKDFSNMDAVTGSITLDELGIAPESVAMAASDDPLVISYRLKKEMVNTWQAALGTQYQFNKHWQVRAELGYNSSSYALITGLSYRFGF